MLSAYTPATAIAAPLSYFHYAASAGAAELFRAAMTALRLSFRHEFTPPAALSPHYFIDYRH